MDAGRFVALRSVVKCESVKEGRGKVAVFLEKDNFVGRMTDQFSVERLTKKNLKTESEKES